MSSPVLARSRLAQVAWVKASLALMLVALVVANVTRMRRLSLSVRKLGMQELRDLSSLWNPSLSDDPVQGPYTEEFLAQTVHKEIIHSIETFLPELHSTGGSITSYPEMECSCPGDAVDSWSTFTQSDISQGTPQTPLRIALEYQEPAAALSEVYVINLPSRTDRRHYMCRCAEWSSC